MSPVEYSSAYARAHGSRPKLAMPLPSTTVPTEGLDDFTLTLDVLQGGLWRGWVAWQGRPLVASSPLTMYGVQNHGH